MYKIDVLILRGGKFIWKFIFGFKVRFFFLEIYKNIVLIKGNDELNRNGM